MFWKDFGRAISAYGEGIKLINQLKLWKFFFIPALIGLLVGATIIWGGYALSGNIGEYLSSWYPFEWGSGIIEWIADIIGGGLILILGYLMYKHIVLAFSAPFMSPVSEKIEKHLTGANALESQGTFTSLLIRGIRLAIRNILLELLITIPLLILGIIPLIGFLSPILLFYVQAFYCGFGNMDYTLERHRKYNQTPAFVRKNKGLAFGNGAVFMLSLLIPFVGIMLTLPISTAAATVVTVERLNQTK
ncbi:MAG: EI24 domain-containing protein [Crocinitomicaceae bacterium]|nr:EI24 domain-containing protein [Crocinitomicaceae bacterium]